MTLGQRLAQARRARGLSQEALAHAVGVSRQAVSKWELDEAQPDAAKIVLLAQALGVTTDQLLLGDDPGPEEQKPEEPEPAFEPAPQGPRDAAYSSALDLRFLRRLLFKHGYKAGYILIAWGAALLLFSGIMFFVISSFFSAAQDMAQDPWEDLWPGSFQGGVEFSLAPGVSLTPQEEQAILDQINGVHHLEPEHGGEHR